MEGKTNPFQDDDVTSGFTQSIPRSCQEETSTPERGKTAVPAWLRGCLLHKGTGRQDVGLHRYSHVVDGLQNREGYAIRDDGTTDQSAFLRSEGSLENTNLNTAVPSECGEVEHADSCASIFDRLSSFLLPSSCDSALMNAVSIGDEYYTMRESPYLDRIDPGTLDKISEFHPNDALAVIAAMSHPLLDPTDGTTYRVGSSKSGYVVVKFPAGESAPQRAMLLATLQPQRRLHPAYIHSFGLTEHYLLILEQSLTVNIVKALADPYRKKPCFECLEFDRDLLVCFHVLDKVTGKCTRTKYVAEPFLIFHHINAYELDHHLVVDVCAHNDDTILAVLCTDASKSPGVGGSLSSTPRRYVLPLRIEDISRRSHTNMVRLSGTSATARSKEDGTVHLQHEDLRPCGSSFSCEAPRLNSSYVGKLYRYFYAVAYTDGSETSLIKMDIEKKTCQTYSVDGWVPTEPVFVARPGASVEDDGVVVSAFLNKADERTVRLVILDGESFEEVKL